METVTLKNGATEVVPLVTATMMALESLLEEHVTVFYDLVMRCRDPEYAFFGNAEPLLRDLNLYPIHDSVRNVVLSAVIGDGLGMTLRSPVAESQ